MTIFLPSRKFLLGMFTHRWTALSFSPWMTAAVLRIKSSVLSEVTMSTYSALHYTQLVNYILRTLMKPFKGEDVLRSAAVMDEKEFRLKYEYDVAGLVNEAFVKVY